MFNKLEPHIGSKLTERNYKIKINNFFDWKFKELVDYNDPNWLSEHSITFKNIMESLEDDMMSFSERLSKLSTN